MSRFLGSIFFDLCEGGSRIADIEIWQGSRRARFYWAASYAYLNFALRAVCAPVPTVGPNARVHMIVLPEDTI